MRTNICFEPVGSEVRRFGRTDEVQCTSSLTWNTLSTENDDKAKGVFAIRRSNQHCTRSTFDTLRSAKRERQTMKE